MGRIPPLWKQLKPETTKKNNIDRLTMIFFSKETANDSVDIYIGGRLVSNINKVNLGQV